MKNVQKMKILILKTKLESAYSFMLKYSKITVCYVMINNYKT